MTDVEGGLKRLSHCKHWTMLASTEIAHFGPNLLF